MRRPGSGVERVSGVGGVDGRLLDLGLVKLDCFRISEIKLGIKRLRG